LRLKLRETLERDVREAIIPFVESATLPEPILEKLKPFGLLKHFFKKPYGLGTSCLKQGVLFAELSRIDPGLATFFAVQAGLLGYTIETLGS
jgi:alkylation response protein AidB-like acyl-CoA dehydrogenase